MSRPASSLTISAVGTIVFGLGLLAFSVARAFAIAAPPFPLTLALSAAGGLHMILGAGVLMRSRTAWAFAVSLGGVVIVVGLLALPALIHGGLPPLAGAGALALISAAEVGLATSGGELRSLDTPAGKD